MLLYVLDGFDPTKWPIVQRQRSVLLIGMFRTWCIYAVVSWAQEAKDEEEETGDNEGIGDGGVDRILLDLHKLYEYYVFEANEGCSSN